MEFKFNVGDTVIILDGEYIDDYTGNFSTSMKDYIGKIAMVIHQRPYDHRPAYLLDIDNRSFIWDERGLSKVSELICDTTSCWTVTHKIDTSANDFQIKKVIFNDPATIVLWSDGTKTVVKIQGDDKYSKEVGLAMCITKKALGNKSNYNNVFKKWCKEN